MRDASPHELAPSDWSGRLEGVSPAELIWEICRAHRTGVIRVTRHPVQRELYVQDGQIVFATSSDPNDRLGERLLRQRKISLDHLEVALGQLRSGKRLGTLLVEAGALTSDELVTAVVCQVRAVVLGVLSWERGDYAFLEGALPTREVITLQMETAALLLHGLRHLRSVGHVQRRVGPPRTTYRLREGGAERVKDMSPSEGERLLVQRLESGPAALDELCRELVVASWEIYQAVHALTILDVIEPSRTRAAEDDSKGREGRLDERALPELLVAIHDSGETGVLQLNRGQVERRLHFDHGRCVFATSTDTDDGLLHSLFRSGVISLGDKEEAARRLLTNKRAGEILRDLGVLDDMDLKDAVHRQVAEIILDSFQWTDGEFVFVPGLLPTHEEITVEFDHTRLLTEGIRRVGSWTRLIHGCGGVDEPQGLTRRYMEVLDAIGAGVEEWDVVNALKSPQTPRRICRLSELDDFRICQILWTLRLLGAVETLSDEALEEAYADCAGQEQAVEPQIDSAGEDGVGDEPAPTTEELQAALRELPDKVHGAIAPDWNIPGSEGESTPPEEAEPEWEGPADLDDVVRRFNEMHRVVYRAVRAEIGAGAVNFIHACCTRLGAECAEVVENVELHPDGSWDPDGLKLAIRSRHIEDPWPVYQTVLDQVYVELKPHLGGGKAESLKARILEMSGQEPAGGPDQSGSL
jgi:hypothetical protein